MLRNRKVFGIGWAKTGTTTLGKCMRLLGYDHESQRLDLVPGLKTGDLAQVLKVAAARESFDDWPWIVLFKELDAAFPGSKFVMTTREPRSWLASYRNMLGHLGEASPEMNEIRSILYGLPFPNVRDEQLLERYHAHQREVTAHFSGRPDDLLVVDWAAGDGWEKLCAFLGFPVPAVPFPHENRGKYRKGRSGGLLSRVKKRLGLG